MAQALCFSPESLVRFLGIKSREVEGLSWVTGTFIGFYEEISALEDLWDSTISSAAFSSLSFLPLEDSYNLNKKKKSF